MIWMFETREDSFGKTFYGFFGLSSQWDAILMVSVKFENF